MPQCAVPQYRRILIIKPSSLGDIIHALPVLAALRGSHPDAHIAWLVGTAFATLLEGHPLLNEVIPFDRQRYGKMVRHPAVFGDFLRFVSEIRRRRFDLIIDLQGLFRSGVLAWASGAGRRVGFADARELAALFYTRRVRCPRSVRHAVEKNLCVAAALGTPAQDAGRGGPTQQAGGCSGGGGPALHMPVGHAAGRARPAWQTALEPATGGSAAQSGRPLFSLGLRDEELQAARQLLLEARPARRRPLQSRGPLPLLPDDAAPARAAVWQADTVNDPGEPFTAVLPGARWESKIWPPERWAALIGRLHAEDHSPCVLLGAGSDRALTDRIIAARTAPVIDLVGRTSLRQLVAVLTLAERVICQDSGPMHIAAALNKPLVAIFGPTNPGRTGPYSPAARVLALPLECAPCYRHLCPLGHHACLEQLTVERVLEEVRKLGFGAGSCKAPGPRAPPHVGPILAPAQP